MSTTLTELERESGWRGINEGGMVFQKTLQDWIGEYFHVNEDLADFQRRNDCFDRGLEIRSADHSKGYVFVGPIQLDRDFERRMMETRELYQNSQQIAIRSFTDFENQMAGFFWRGE